MASQRKSIRPSLRHFKNVPIKYNHRWKFENLIRHFRISCISCLLTHPHKHLKHPIVSQSLQYKKMSYNRRSSSSLHGTIGVFWQSEHFVTQSTQAAQLLIQHCGQIRFLQRTHRISPSNRQRVFVSHLSHCNSPIESTHSERCDAQQVLLLKLSSRIF